MRCKRVVAVLAAGLLFTIGWPLAALAQEEPSADEQAADTGDTAADQTEEKKKGKIPFNLYVYAGAGLADVEPLNTSLETTVNHLSQNSLTLDEAGYYKAAIGWKMPHGKGDFRLIYTGYRENGYTYEGIGRSATLPGGDDSAATVLQVLDWWTVNIDNGALSAERNPPRWDPLLDDTNGDGAVSRDEVTQGGPTDPLYLVNSRQVAPDLGNTAQHVDLIYGRQWGGRRYSGRWWGGLRYFNYEGNVIAGAWLNTALPGSGYSDGSTLRAINFYQESKGGGPTVAAELDFNFFDKLMTIYAGAQAAFVMLDLETDTGEFFTLVDPSSAISGTDVSNPVEARLNETRTKSTWQNSAEVGLRFNLKSGLEFELAYHIQGYLDVVLMPSRIQIPETENQAQDCGNDPGLQGCTTAIYQTQDLVMDGWRIGVGFQF